MTKIFQIITFYQFKTLTNLPELRDLLKNFMRENRIFGTIILAEEGFNSTVCGEPETIEKFAEFAENVLQTKLTYKSSFHDACPFQRIKVKIKPEIVTLKQKVDIKKGIGTHKKPKEWNEIISDPETIVLDARNRYEYKSGTFRGAVNPETEKFSDLPAFVRENLNPEKHKKVAMFCTGGVRCEKFAPFLVDLGFREVFQLEGGILKYLEEIPAEENLWQGECFVFDERISVDKDLKKGSMEDFSQENE
jgi:UPF0176 protein